MTVKVKTAEEAVKLVAGQGKKKASTVVRDATASSVRGFRQGDVYLLRVPKDMEVSLKGMERLKSLKIAEGDTKGSRHILEGDVKAYRGDLTKKLREVYADEFAKHGDSFFNEYFVGPVVVTGSKGAVLTHPEHAHFKLSRNTTYQTYHQVDAYTRERVRD